MRPLTRQLALLCACGLVSIACAPREAAPSSASASSTTMVVTNNGVSTIQLGTGASAITIEIDRGVGLVNGTGNVVVNSDSRTTITINGAEVHLEGDRIVIGGRAFGPVHGGSHVHATAAGVLVDGGPLQPWK
ncbi:MAG: hypothetical protein IPJ19_08070 [Planctomycetes bacterium]|nr:hypothetical protein [Planctomycetota bacterium]